MCDDLGMLLIYDEIQTGFGRVGEWFASSLYDVEPDIMVIGKGLGGGFPIFGTLSRDDLQAVLSRRPLVHLRPLPGLDGGGAGLDRGDRDREPARARPDGSARPSPPGCWRCATATS